MNLELQNEEAHEVGFLKKTFQVVPLFIKVLSKFHVTVVRTMRGWFFCFLRGRRAPVMPLFFMYASEKNKPTFSIWSLPEFNLCEFTHHFAPSGHHKKIETKNAPKKKPIQAARYDSLFAPDQPSPSYCFHRVCQILVLYF